MEKQTKNLITREWVEKELRFGNTADIRSALVLCGAFSFFFLPLTVGVVYGICVSLEPVLLKIIFSVLVGAVTSAPIWLMLFGLWKALAERNLLQRGDFEVVTREVSYKSEKAVHRHMEEYLHFSGFQERSVGHTDYQLASQGDEFYIVHYCGKGEIKLFYPTKTYELK